MLMPGRMLMEMATPSGGNFSNCPRQEITIVLIISPPTNTHITFFPKILEGEGTKCSANSHSLNHPRPDTAESTLGTIKQGVPLEARVLGILVVSFAL